MNIFSQSAVGIGGGLEGFFGGEGEVVGAAGEDGLGAAFGLADVDQGPAGHVVGEGFIDKGEVVVDDLEVVESQFVGADSHHRAVSLEALAEGVETQGVNTLQVGRGEGSEEGGDAADFAEPLLHDGQHAVAHRHAGQQEGGVGEAWEEDHRGAPHQADEAVVSRGGACEHRLCGYSEQRPEAAAVRQLLSRDELCAGAALGLTGVRRAGDHFSVAEIEGDSASFQAAIDQQPHGFLSCHNLMGFKWFIKGCKLIF